MDLSTLFNHKKVIFSLEIFPPKKDTPYNVIYNTLLKLRGLPVDFISVTYGAGGSVAQREKTVEIASLILTTYHIEPVAHLTCVNSDRREISETLSKLKEGNIQNILALRGDITAGIPPKEEFKHASDLAKFIKETDPSFNLIGGCYPECHPECENPDRDIENLKIKIDSGVSHLITQLFFDNRVFYEFREKAVQAGIHVPIEAGIMPIVNKNQVERTVTMCGARVQPKMARFISKYCDDPVALKDAGLFYATEQIMDLIDNGVQGIHLYTMNNVETASRISENIQNIIAAENQMPREGKSV